MGPSRGNQGWDGSKGTLLSLPRRNETVLSANTPEWRQQHACIHTLLTQFPASRSLPDSSMVHSYHSDIDNIVLIPDDKEASHSVVPLHNNKALYPFMNALLSPAVTTNEVSQLCPSLACYHYPKHLPLLPRSSSSIIAHKYFFRRDNNRKSPPLTEFTTSPFSWIVRRSSRIPPVAVVEACSPPHSPCGCLPRRSDEIPASLALVTSGNPHHQLFA
jgi:hypothetical protein